MVAKWIDHQPLFALPSISSVARLGFSCVFPASFRDMWNSWLYLLKPIASRKARISFEGTCE